MLLFGCWLTTYVLLWLVEKELEDLQNKLNGNETEIVDEQETEDGGTKVISISETTTGANSTTSLCGKYVDIPDTLWNTEYAEHINFDDIRCVFIEFSSISALCVRI